MKYKLLVVTVTYKPDYEELSTYVDSFFKFNDLGEEAKLVIVDNSPTHSWDAVTFMEQYPIVAYIPNPENPGFGAANNRGFESFDSDYVLFMNNDAEFTESVFAKLIQIHESDEKIGCIGIHQTGGAPSFFKKMTAPKGIDSDNFNDNYHFISGAFMFFKSSVFKKVGMFDPKIFMYFEEFDMSERLIAKGYKTIFINNLKFLHKAGNRKTMNEFAARKGAKTFVYICKKYGIDCKKANKYWLHRMWKLVIYHTLKLNIAETIKIIKIINYRHSVIAKYFYDIPNNKSN